MYNEKQTIDELHEMANPLMDKLKAGQLTEQQEKALWPLVVKIEIIKQGKDAVRSFVLKKQFSDYSKELTEALKGLRKACTKSTIIADSAIDTIPITQPEDWSDILESAHMMRAQLDAEAQSRAADIMAGRGYSRPSLARR